MCVDLPRDERCEYVADLVRCLQGDPGHEACAWFVTIDFELIEIPARVGRIRPSDVDRLLRAADGSTLVVLPILNLRSGTFGAGCYEDGRLLGVFASRDVVVLEQ